MTTYNPVLPLTKWDRFADFCRNVFGASAPEVVTGLVLTLIMGAGIGVVLAVW